MKENPPAVPQFDKLMRNILATNPRVTRFKVDWDDVPRKNVTANGSDGGNMNGNRMEQIMENDGQLNMEKPEPMNVA